MTVPQMAVDAIFHRSESASMSRLSANEGVMVAFEAGVYVRLNESAMLIWDLVDGLRSCALITEAYADYFKISGDMALKDARACLEQFLELQVVYV